MGKYEDIYLPWPDWKIIKYLGSGTYGKVYEIERNVAGVRENAALKLISRPNNASEIEEYYDNGYDRVSLIEYYNMEIQNYIQEYKLMRELQGQPYIVNCHDFAVVPHADGIGANIFLRIELLTSLSQILRQQVLSEKEIIKLGKDISHALMLCEDKGIIHRDIKPDNIMVSQFGDYKLGDFGVSKIMDYATYAALMGTPEYQAPEVVHMERYGKTADIYSLGITLYWLLNNRKMPFISAEERLTSAVKDEATKKRYRGEQFPPPRDGSVEFKRIVLKACAYRPRERYASAGEMYQALDELTKRQMGKTTQAKSNLKEKCCGDEIMGIYFSTSEIYASLYSQGECHILLRMPAVFAITELGEILIGIRAIRYSRCHPEKARYSVYEFIKEGIKSSFFELSYKGMNLNLYRVFCVLMKELRRNLDKKSYENIRKCVVSLSSCNVLYWGVIKRVMEDVGFSVKQMISFSVAYEAYKSFYNHTSRKYVTSIAGGDTQRIGQDCLVEGVAAGAAIQGAKLSGILQDNDSVHDVMPIGLGLEIISEKEQILRPSVWRVEEQAPIPAKSAPLIYSRKNGGYNDGNVMLKLLMGHAYEVEPEEVAHWYLSDIYNFFDTPPEELEIQLEVRESYVLSLILTNPSNKETRTIDIMRYKDGLAVVSPLEKTVKVSKKEALVQIRGVIQQFENEIKALNDDEKKSAAGKGLLMIEKQCGHFLENIKEKDIESVATMIDNLLQIVDSFEYGIRNFSVKDIRRPEEITGEIYQKFLQILKIYLDIIPIEAEGMFFDANLHFAIMHVEDERIEEGIVVEELQRGYYWGKQMFRAAKVKVAN